MHVRLVNFSTGTFGAIALALMLIPLNNPCNYCTAWYCVFWGCF